MASDQKFINALISRWTRLAEDRETLITEITALADAAWAQIQAGNGEVSFIRQTGQNGKSVNIDATMTCKDTFALMEEALELLDAGSAPDRITYMDISTITER